MFWTLVELGINIVKVSNDRPSPDILPRLAGVSLSIEMENESYAERLISSLREKGIHFTI